MPKIQVDLNEQENNIVTKLQEVNEGLSKEYIIKMIISKVQLKERETNAD